MCSSKSSIGICSPLDTVPLAFFTQTPSNWTKVPNCHCHSVHNYPRSRRIHLPESQQRQHLRLESAAQPWDDLELPNCHRQSLHHPRSRRIHLSESQQRPYVRLESAAHPWADLELPNCPRQRYTEQVLRSSLPSFVPPFVRPFVRSFVRSFVPSFVRSFVRSFLRSFVCSSGLNLLYTPLSSWADPELPNCHRHRILHRRSRRIHLPEWQQRPHRWIESASHLWADPGLPNCHRHCILHLR